MKLPVSKTKLLRAVRPKSGFSHFAHLIFTAILPALVFVFVRIGFPQIALALILLSKWRMFAVRPRHWWPLIRANAVDLLVGLSVLAFMLDTPSVGFQLMWATLYSVWLLIVKPRSGVVWVSLQASLGQLAALSALFIGLPELTTTWMTVYVGLICYLSARHFFSGYEEPHAPFYAHYWSFFGAALAWVLGHWLLFYGNIAQPVVLLTVIGYSLATLYYLSEADRLSTLLRRQFVFIMVTVVVVILVFSDWGDKTI